MRQFTLTFLYFPFIIVHTIHTGNLQNRKKKSQSKTNTIHGHRIDNTVCDDANQIANCCSNFSKSLYSSRYCEDGSVSFLDSLVDIGPINSADQEFCERPISLKEIIDSIKSLKNNKSLSEFYKSFSKELAPFLLKVFCERCSPSHINTGLNNPYS